MSIFSTILEKLGIKKPAAQAAPSPQTTTAKPPLQTTPVTQAPSPKPAFVRPPTFDVIPESHIPTTPQVSQAQPAVPTAIPMVDVVSKLDKLAADSGQKLDWKVSIVDMLKILHMDSSLTARKELATELGCPPELMTESTNMNIWLHKTVLQKLAENGGNIPKELLKK